MANHHHPKAPIPSNKIKALHTSLDAKRTHPSQKQSISVSPPLQRIKNIRYATKGQRGTVQGESAEFPQ